jgi:hypothetical protein
MGDRPGNTVRSLCLPPQLAASGPAEYGSKMSQWVQIAGCGVAESSPAGIKWHWRGRHFLGTRFGSTVAG